MIYSRQSTALHAAKPVATIAWAASLTLAVVVCSHPAALAVLAAGTVGLAVLAKVPRPVLLATLVAVPFGLIWVLTNALFVRDGLTVIARLGELPPFGQLDITLEAVVQGAILALRGTVALQLGILLSAVVDPDRLLVAVRRVAPRAGLTGAVAMRLAPALADDGHRYADGLRCRADGGHLAASDRVLVLSATVGRAIDRASTVASVLELRGMSDARRLPAGRRAVRSRHDWAVALSALAVAAVALIGSSTGVVAFVAYPAIDAAPALPAMGWALAVLVLAALPLAARRGTEPPR